MGIDKITMCRKAQNFHRDIGQLSSISALRDRTPEQAAAWLNREIVDTTQLREHVKDLTRLCLYLLHLVEGADRPVIDNSPQQPAADDSPEGQSRK